jgi:glutaconate CoA-transferase, subunit A
MAELVSLAEAIRDLVQDGSQVALEGFTHLIPFAAGHEIIRQRRRDLAVVRMTPDLVYDQLIGAGCVSKMVFSWGGNPGVGSLHRFRDAVEHGFPQPLAIEEHSHAGMAARYVAGASRLPFGVLRGYIGSDLAERSDVATVSCPFTGEHLAAVPALNPDVTIIHAQQADTKGNIGLWGITGVQKEAVLAARTVIVTVEEIVDQLTTPGPNPILIPAWTVDAVACVPRGSYPSYAMGYTDRDNSFYRSWDAISRDRVVFERWLEVFVYEQADHAAYLNALEDPAKLAGVLGE